MNRRLGMTAALVVALACSCKNHHSKMDDWPNGGESHVLTQPTEAKGVDAPPAREPLTAAKLSPVIHELGPDNVVPTSISIQLATAAIEPNDVGTASAKSHLKITPDVPGTLAFTGVSELTFTPSRPFEFDTEYKVELLDVETVDGVIAQPPADQWGDKWKMSFKTPKFAFLEWAPSDLDVAKHSATMEITFSGAVLPNVALKSLAITIDGRAPAGMQMLPSHEQNIIIVKLTDSRIVLGAKLGLVVKKDLVALSGVKADAAKAEFEVSADEAISIKHVSVVEGGSGFYLEVVCDDKAAPDAHRSAYDEDESYYDLSERCQLSDVSHISFTPAVKKTYITSGRAGFRIFGDFKRGVYKMKISGGATSVDGGVLLASYTNSFAVTARKPTLGFASTGRYLPRSAWTNLAIKHINVDKVNLVVRQVPQENLVFWLGDERSEAADERTSNVILKKETPLRGDPDEPTTTWIDVASLLPKTTSGVLELKVTGVGAEASSRLLLTNMSLVAKKTPIPDKPWEQRVQVWGLDMDSNSLLSDVEVSLVRKSGKTVARCTTDGASGCAMQATNDDDIDQAEPFALIARRGDDLTYIRYKDLRAEAAESNTNGIPYIAATPYRASIFFDRGVYRPGDTAHITAIVRDIKDRAPDQTLPVEVKLVDPRAKVARKIVLKTNAAGVITLDHTLAQFADTGRWRVDLSVGDKPLATDNLDVEEFVPERMKVEVAAKKSEILDSDTASFDVNARYLFGGSALDSGVVLRCSIQPDTFVPEENSDLTYGIEPKGKPVVLGETDAQLDAKGQASIDCAEPEEKTTFAGTGTLTANVSVLESGSGRATVKNATLTVHPEKFYIGVKTKAVRAESGTTFQVEGMVVDWKGKLLPNAVKQLSIDLIHLEADYNYGYDDESGESRYDRWLREAPEGKITTNVTGGKFMFDVTPGNASGGYLVRLTAGKARTDLVMDGEYSYDYYEYGDGGRVDETPRPSRPTQLKLDVPKEIKVGESVTIKAKAPYRGKVLWTVETDHVVTSEWKEITSTDASWSFKLSTFAPNVYVSAFLIKDPHAESKLAFMPDRAFGMTSIKVSPTDFIQTVKLDVPKEIRSSSQLSVKLDAGPVQPGTFAIVSVVDEGILQLTSFKTPDPLAELFAKRALGVETYETIGWTMLHQPAGSSSKTGGGDDMVEGESQGSLAGDRVQPVKPVAMFSGVLPVGTDGKITIPFNVPSYRGQLRVMAITAGPQKIGRAEAEVTVKDPLVIQVTFPRFVTQNDELQVPVFLTNMSGAPLDVSVELNSTTIAIAGLAPAKNAVAPLAFPTKNTGSVKIENGRAETLVFQAVAKMPVGGAKLRVVAKAKGSAGTFEVADEVDVPFLPAGPKERVVQKIKVTAGKLDLASQTALKNWVPTSESTTFWLTNNPYGESFDHLKYLIHYPYGCIEQTTSSTRPLLYLSSIVEQVDPELAELKIEDMVLSGINRVLSMETPSGGFGYWPGSDHPVDWGTAYATHMLIDAKKRGYAVPEDRLQNVIAWIEGRVNELESRTWQTQRSWYYEEQGEVYLNYVLALAGKGHKARILKLIEHLPADAKAEQSEDLYMLEAALYLAGDRRYEKQLKNPDTSPIMNDRYNSWSFYSDRRRRGMMLSTFQDLFGNDPAGELLATRVAEGLNGQRSEWYTTQELVWGVTGLGKWVVAMNAHGVAGGTLTADGTVINPRKPKQKTTDMNWSLSRASEYKSLVLDVPQSADGMYLVIASTGVRPGSDYKEGGNGLAVTREYKKLDGSPANMTDGSIQLGDVVFVEVTLTNKTRETIQNIALVDRLPAGFEVENPRLGRSVQTDWIKEDEQWSVDFLNFRDDHLEAFGAIEGSYNTNVEKKVTYSIRAVTSGKYTTPPVEAEAMYDPTIWAREKGQTTVVGGPWTGKLL